MTDMGPDGRCVKCGHPIGSTSGVCPRCNTSEYVGLKPLDYKTLLSLYLGGQQEIERLREQKRKDDLAYKGMETQALDERREVVRLSDLYARARAILEKVKGSLMLEPTYEERQRIVDKIFVFLVGNGEDNGRQDGD